MTEPVLDTQPTPAYPQPRSPDELWELLQELHSRAHGARHLGEALVHSAVITIDQLRESLKSQLEERKNGIHRLLEIGIDPFNFSDSLLAILAQRLVRRLCKQCVTSRHGAESRHENPAPGWHREGGARPDRHWRGDRRHQPLTSFYNRCMLQYLTIPVTPFQQNCSLVWCDQTKDAAVIDPGGDLDVVLAEAQRLGLKLTQIWLTHAHIDHAGGTATLAERLRLPIIGPHPGDQFWIDGLPQQSQMFGFPPAGHFTPTRWLADGDTVQVGQSTLQVRHCPGHTPGHVVFHSPQAKRAFVGDVLFAGSIGRTDFPQGNHEQLIASIRERLWPMGDDTVFIPGHGPESTFGRERRSNPYVRDPM